MGIDGMRVGGGRCPPLLVGGLLVACLMLVCNWWTLSSENIELLRQIDELGEQLKISAEERDQCVTLRGNLEQRYKRTEDELASVQVRLEQQIDLKKKNDELEDSVTMCKSELDSLTKLDTMKTGTLEMLRLEKDAINTQLDAKREENKKLQEELEKVQSNSELDRLKPLYNTPTVKGKTHIESPRTSAKQSVAKNNGDEQRTPDTGDLRSADGNNEDGEARADDEPLAAESDRDLEMKAPSGSDRPEDANSAAV